MRATTLVIWAGIVVVSLVLEGLGRRRAIGLDPAEQALRAMRAAPLGQAALILGWMWLGWHLFAR